MDEELYVLVAERDTSDIEDKSSRPIVFEQYLDQGFASLQNAKSNQSKIDGLYGKVRIAKLVFIDD